MKNKVPIPIADYHIHTYLCGHAVGQAEDYIAQAMNVGLEEIGFSDHAPLVAYQDPHITMSMEQLPLYHHMIEDFQKRFSEIKIKIGIEADFIIGYEARTKAILQGYPYDYVIGSVHFIDAWAFDCPKHKARWDEKDIDDVYRDYFELLRRCAESRMFDIIGHTDLVKKFGHRPTGDLSRDVRKTAKAFKKSGVAIEINTSGLRKPVNEIYPSLENLKIYCEENVPIVFGSDAHAPDEVAKDFNKAVALAKTAGYKEYLLFKGRKIERRVRL